MPWSDDFMFEHVKKLMLPDEVEFVGGIEGWSFLPKQLFKADRVWKSVVSNAIIAKANGRRPFIQKNIFWILASPNPLDLRAWTMKIYFIIATWRELEMMAW